MIQASNNRRNGWAIMQTLTERLW